MSTLRLPRLVEIEDYHECDDLQYKLRQLTGTNDVKVKEVGFSVGAYVAVVYTGKKPSKGVILNLAEMQHIRMDREMLS